MAPLLLQQAIAGLPSGALRRTRQRGSLGIVWMGPSSKLNNKKRKLLTLPTIVEEDSEDSEEDLVPPATAPLAALQHPPLSSWLPESFTEPRFLASSAPWTKAVEARLKTACETDRSVLLTWLCSALPDLAHSENGSGLVQLACKVATGTERTMLVSPLQGFVASLCVSPHGHQALISLIETMPMSKIGFVAHELVGRAGEMARNRFGYRVCEALIMHCTEAQMSELGQEFISETVELARHGHGNFVMQHLLEYGTASYKTEIIRRLMPETSLLAMDRTASHVVAKALGCAVFQEQCLIALALLQAATPISLVDVACSRGGSSILVEIADIGACGAEFRPRLLEALPRLVKSKFGRRVGERFGLM